MNHRRRAVEAADALDQGTQAHRELDTGLQNRQR
jgi:hypothetical protein